MSPVPGRLEEVASLDENRGSALKGDDRFQAEQLVVVELVSSPFSHFGQPIDAVADDPVTLSTRRRVGRFALGRPWQALEAGLAQSLSQFTGITEQPPDVVNDPTVSHRKASNPVGDLRVVTLEDRS